MYWSTVLTSSWCVASSPYTWTGVLEIHPHVTSAITRFLFGYFVALWVKEDELTCAPAGGRKPKTHQPASNGSFELGIKKRPRESKGALRTSWRRPPAPRPHSTQDTCRALGLCCLLEFRGQTLSPLPKWAPHWKVCHSHTSFDKALWATDEVDPPQHILE